MESGCMGVGVGVGEGVWVGVAVGDGVSVGVGVAVGDGVSVFVAVGEGDGIDDVSGALVVIIVLSAMASPVGDETDDGLLLTWQLASKSPNTNNAATPAHILCLYLLVFI